MNIKRLREKVEFVKKINLANSALLVCDAKNVRITDNKSKSFVFCVFMTQGMKLFSFYTSLNFIRQKFFIFFCKKSCIQKYNLHSCSFLSNKWSKPPIRYP